METAGDDPGTPARFPVVTCSYAAHRVWTGSQNWVGGSLWRSDELTLNIRLRSAYRSYLKNWDTVRDHSRRLPYDVYGR